MSGQRRWIKVWARTVGMPVGATDDDKPEFPSYQAVRCYQGSRLPNLLDRSPCCHLPYDRSW
jgi:hypothetical protein